VASSRIALRHNLDTCPGNLADPYPAADSLNGGDPARSGHETASGLIFSRKQSSAARDAAAERVLAAAQLRARWRSMAPATSPSCRRRLRRRGSARR
jgi:hypothetical protein